MVKNLFVSNIMPIFAASNSKCGMKMKTEAANISGIFCACEKKNKN